MRLVRFNGVRNRSVRRWGPEYASIHYTAGDGTALDNCRYFEYNPQGTRASADYVIDKDGTTVQYNCDPRGHYTWAVGDGKGRYGISNANCVHIEVVSSGEDFTEAQIAALSELVPQLMREFGIPPERVVRHYEASRKLCPKPYIDNAKWRALHARITSGQTQEDDMLKDQTITRPDGHSTDAATMLGYMDQRIEGLERDNADMKAKIDAIFAEVTYAGDNGAGHGTDTGTTPLKRIPYIEAQGKVNAEKIGAEVL